MPPKTDRPIIRPSRIRGDLEALGLAAGQTVILHSSVKTIGWVVGGPDTVLSVILDVLGPAGTLMMLAGWEDDPYELADWPEERQRAYIEEGPSFDPVSSRAAREMVGILGEYLRTRPGARRSNHPVGSFVALGARADWLTARHPLTNGYGPEGPLGGLIEADGKVLMLGAPLETITLLHCAEYLADIPDKRTVSYRMPVLQDGARTWVDIQELDSSKGVRTWVGEGDYFEAIARAFLASGQGREGRVGEAPSYLFDAATLVPFAAAWMEAEHAAGRF